jgi:hypothetical protein
MTQPLGSFNTNFGRFYAHPAAATSTESRHGTILASQITPLSAGNPDDPYAPKPSITNIIGMMSKDFLPPIYAKLVATYAVEHLDQIADLVKRFGPDVAIGTLKGTVNQPHPAAAIGDEVHSAIDALIRDEEATPLTSTTAVRMFAQFAHFLEVFRPEVIRSEYTVWSYGHGYAGTGDLMWRTADGLWIVDTKTGARIHPEVAMQTAAIANADVILDASGAELPMPPGDILGVIHVRPMSVKLHRLEREAEAFEAFLACKRIFDWRRFDAEQVIQEPFKTERPKAA